MTRKFACRTVPSTWMAQNGRRLDCGPYMSGGIEARELLKRHPAIKARLGDLMQGIFHAGREGRQWVQDPEYGIPFLGSTDILASDLSNLPLISKKQIKANPNFTIHKGWTLITRSGTIGRMAYARADMDGLACSEHVMRVVPDEHKILPGYIYAYLSSRFGVPLVISGTYGSIIQSIEPHHIADLPVPRLGEVEEQAHALVQRAADLRTEASSIIAQGIKKMEDAAGIPHLEAYKVGSEFDAVVVLSNVCQKRFDALFHGRYHNDVTDTMLKSGSGVIIVGNIAESIIEPIRFKRLPIDDETVGVPFFGTSSLMWLDPKPTCFLPPRQRGIDKYIISQSTLLIPRSGQLSGIIGTAILPYGDLVGGAVTEDAIRVNCSLESDAGYLLIALRSEYGKRQLKSRAYGSSIPHLDVSQIHDVKVPNLDSAMRADIGSSGLKATLLRGQAIDLEDHARALVENAIEAGGRSWRR